jgi:hypothetical protein
MINTNDQLSALNDIRKMMSESSKFLSLSGFSGVFAGLFAIAGAWLGDHQINRYFSGKELLISVGNPSESLAFIIVIICLLVLILSLGLAFYLSKKKAQKKGYSLFDASSKKLVINIAIPLVTGGVFSLAMLFQGGMFIYLIAPAMLIFYGLALLNGSKYTFHEIRILAILEIILGVIALFKLGYGLLFWTIGFGVLHIIYGTLIWFKHDRK